MYPLYWKLTTFYLKIFCFWNQNLPHLSPLKGISLCTLYIPTNLNIYIYMNNCVQQIVPCDAHHTHVFTWWKYSNHRCDPVSVIMLYVSHTHGRYAITRNDLERVIFEIMNSLPMAFTDDTLNAQDERSWHWTWAKLLRRMIKHNVEICTAGQVHDLIWLNDRQINRIQVHWPYKYVCDSSWTNFSKLFSYIAIVIAIVIKQHTFVNYIQC